MIRYTLSEFYNEVHIGQEFGFGYGDREFTLSQAPGKIFIIEDGKEDTEYVFDSAKDIAENFILDGKKFKDIINKIEF